MDKTAFPEYFPALLWGFQFLLTIVMAATGWFLRGLSNRQDLQQAALIDLERKLHATEVDLPKNYVRKADMESLMNDIRDHLVRIEAKIDGKADK